MTDRSTPDMPGAAPPPPPTSPTKRSPLVLVAAAGAAVLALVVAVSAWRSLVRDAETPIVAGHSPGGEVTSVVVTEETCQNWGRKAGAFMAQEASYAEAGATAALIEAQAVAQQEATVRNKCMAEVRGKRIPVRLVRCFEQDAHDLMSFSVCFGTAVGSAR